VPFPATAVMVPLALSLAGSEAQQRRWLGELSSGRTIAGASFGEMLPRRAGASISVSDRVLSGRALFVIDFEADVYLVAAQDHTLYLVESSAKGLTRNLLPTIDGTRRLGELVFDGVTAELLPGSVDGHIATCVLDAGRIMLAADTLGAAQTMLDSAVAYAKGRVQFGRPIGSFQAVKHMCAEMAAELEPCRAMLWYAAYAFEAIRDEARLTACHTKAHLCEVATQVARTATEVHGGIGFTDELGLHLWFKRIGANRQLLGSPDQLREEAAQIQRLVEQ